jgi:Protein of unknown function (DUF3237)
VETRFPDLEFVCKISIVLAPALEIGETPSGQRRIVNILEGTVEGPQMHGVVLEGGADWQVTRTDDVVELQANYILKMSDGKLILVRNRGLRTGPPDVLQRIASGDVVAPDEYYCRTTPVFEAPSGKYEWLNRSVFVATAQRYASAIEVNVFRVK